jgi:4-hydroxybenzoate polyprenyltransferase
MRRYILMLPIFWLILLILGLSGPLKAHLGPFGIQTNISQFVCGVLVVFYLFQAICGLNHLDFSGDNLFHAI